MKFQFSFFTLLAVALLFASCKKTNTEGRYIPANALMALHIDAKSLSEKLAWSEIKSNPLFEKAYSDSGVSATVKKILDNPDNSGIDTKASLILFLQKDAEGGYMTLEGTLKNEAAFKAMCTEMLPNATVSQKDGISFMSKASTCVGWGKDRFVFVSDAPQLGQMDELSKRMKRDSIDISNHKPRDINAACKAAFDLEKSKSLAENERFTKLVAEKGDAHIWINSEEFGKAAAASGPAAMFNLEKLYKGSITGATLNFDNGKINVNAHTYPSEDLVQLYKKYGGGKVDTDMLQHIPGKDIMAVVALNFKPEGLKEFLKLTGLDGFLNIGAASLGFTLDDFVKANKGDIMFGISDFKMAEDTTEKFASKQKEDEEINMPLMPKPQLNFVFAGSIGDKDAFNKLETTGKKAVATFMNSGNTPFAYSSNGKWFALSNTQQNADGAVNGKGSNFDFIGKIAGGPMAGYFNIQSTIKGFEIQASKDSSAKIVYDASLKMWETVLIKGGDFSGGAVHSTIDINLVDKNTNSLKQLNQYFALIGRLAQENERKQKEDMMALEDALSNGGIQPNSAAGGKQK